MGLTPASMKPYFGVVTVTFAGYACGMTGDDASVPLYLYSAGERAAVTKEVGLVHAKRIGGLGPGAVFKNYGGGDFGLVLKSGKHCVYIDGQLLSRHRANSSRWPTSSTEPWREYFFNTCS